MLVGSCALFLHSSAPHLASPYWQPATPRCKLCTRLLLRTGLQRSVRNSLDTRQRQNSKRHAQHHTPPTHAHAHTHTHKHTRAVYQEAQSAVAEAGALEVALEAMRIHHFTSPAVRLAGVQVQCHFGSVCAVSCFCVCCVILPRVLMQRRLMDVMSRQPSAEDEGCAHSDLVVCASVDGGARSWKSDEQRQDWWGRRHPRSVGILNSVDQEWFTPPTAVTLLSRAFSAPMGFRCSLLQLAGCAPKKMRQRCLLLCILTIWRVQEHTMTVSVCVCLRARACVCVCTCVCM